MQEKLELNIKLKYNRVMLHDNTIEYIWEIKEFEYQEKKKNWYWLVGFVAVLLIAVAIIMSNVLLALLILIGTILIFGQANKEPLVMNVEISNHGIKIHESFHEYETIQAFWMKEKEDHVVLILLTSERMTPLQSLEIPANIDPLELREYLLQYIEERELRESYTEKIMNHIGF